MDLKFFPEAPAERDAANRVPSILSCTQMKQFTLILLFSSYFSFLTTGPMSRGKGQHPLKIDLLVAKRVGLVADIHCIYTLICMSLIIASKIDCEDSAVVVNSRE